MRTSDFDYSLPADLIAQRPPAVRGESRLLSLNGIKPDIEHLSFSDFPSLLSPDDLLIFNNTRVIPARLWAKKITGIDKKTIYNIIRVKYRGIAEKSVFWIYNSKILKGMFRNLFCGCSIRLSHYFQQ